VFIDQQLNTGGLNKLQTTETKLKPIIDAIILCGRQNINQRGHYDEFFVIFKGRYLLVKANLLNINYKHFVNIITYILGIIFVCIANTVKFI